MAQLPADVSPGDGSHDDHHDALHGLYNHLDTVGGGDVTAAWTAAEKSKLATIEALATADQTGAQIKAAYEAEADTNAFDDAAVSKLAAISGTNTGDEPAATVSNPGIIEIASMFEINAGSDAERAVTPAGLAGSDLSGFVSANSVKVSATTANVNAAGAVMNTDTSTSPMDFVVDEDTMSSNSSTKVPTQQSVKAYVDAVIPGPTRNTHTHSASGALTIARASADQYTRTTISADATSWTDNLTTDGDHLLTVLEGDGGSTDYTVDLTGLGLGIQDVYPDSQIELSVLKVGTDLLSVIKTHGGTPSTITLAVSGATASQSTTAPLVSVPGSPSNGDTVIFVSFARSVTEAASVNWTTPTGATVVGTLEPAGGFFPRARIWEKDHDGTSSYTFGNDLSGQCSIIVSLDGNAPSLALSAAVTGNTVSADTIDPPSLTVANGGVIMAFMSGNGSMGGVTPPSGYTEGADATAAGNRGGSVAYKQSSGATEDPGVFTETTDSTFTTFSLRANPT